MQRALFAEPAFEAHFKIVEERFWLMFNDPAAFTTLLTAGIAFANIEHGDNKLALLKMNHFSMELYQAMASGGQSYSLSPIHYGWDRLKQSGIVFQAVGHMPRAFLDHVIDVPFLLAHLRADTFHNIFKPSHCLVNRYASAVVAIDVTTSNGDLHRGTGFIARPDDDRSDVVVTCKHNVDPAEGLVVSAITDSESKAIRVSDPVLHPDLDLAYFRILDDERAPTFRLSSDIEIFDDVFTIGFPFVPGAQSSIVGHRGEMNGKIDNYLEKSPMLLISNSTSPGSSGSPVLDQHGFCVGMAIRWLEGEYGEERAKFSAALPAAEIKAFLKLRQPLEPSANSTFLSFRS